MDSVVSRGAQRQRCLLMYANGRCSLLCRLIEVRMSKEQVESKLRSLEGKLQDAKEEANQMRLKGASGDKHALLKVTFPPGTPL